MSWAPNSGCWFGKVLPSRVFRLGPGADPAWDKLSLWLFGLRGSLQPSPGTKHQGLVAGPSPAGDEPQPGLGWVQWPWHSWAAKCSPGAWNQELGNAKLCSHPVLPLGTPLPAQGLGTLSPWGVAGAGAGRCVPPPRLRAKIFPWELLQCRV